MELASFSFRKRPKKKVPHPAVRMVLNRLWWGLVPLLGVLGAQSQVTPRIAESEQAALEALELQQGRLQRVRARIEKAERERDAAYSIIDTLFTPRYEDHVRVLDSLQTGQEGIATNLPLLQEEIGEIQSRIVALDEPLAEAESARDRMQQEIEDHQSTLGVLQDSLVVLQREQNLLADRLYRLQNPDELAELSASNGGRR